jgi:hypothetical protein
MKEEGGLSFGMKEDEKQSPIPLRGGSGKTSMKVRKNPIKSPPLQGEG